MPGRTESWKTGVKSRLQYLVRLAWRSYMARPLRISYPNAFYHVTCGGNDRRVIFRDDHGRTRFLAQLESALEIFSVLLHAYGGGRGDAVD